MEEPENGIHPERLEAMNRLLHDIAVDPDEPVAEDNPLRQVIVATHSPYFVQLQSPQEIVLAKNTAVKSATGTCGVAAEMLSSAGLVERCCRPGR